MTRSRVLIIVVVTIVFIILLTIFSTVQIGKEAVNLSVIYSVIAGYITFVVSVVKFWIDSDKMEFELITNFNKRFDNINEEINRIYDDSKKHENVKQSYVKENKKFIQDYLNLCSEEYYWYRRKRIDTDVWNSWKSGMKFYLKNEIIKEHFIIEKEFNESYYYLFDEINDILI